MVHMLLSIALIGAISINESNGEESISINETANKSLADGACEARGGAR